ncbi:MAG: 16S rRNA (adenine(1518)-N(6)/adenine(1519)-N(6))-dimethyltransferase RsmA [Gemmatimonadota bacterium]
MRRGRPRLSQHFLHDRRTARRIAASLRAPPGARVLEIGPGEGALTGPLLDRGWRVTAVELDEELAGRLERRWPDRELTVVRADILDHELEGGEPWHVIGNLPYAITSPIVFHLLDQAARVAVPEIVIMVQKELAERLAAAPGSRAYGALTVGVGLAAEVEVLFDVGPGQFRPPPKVRSSVVRIVPAGPAGLAEERRERIRDLVRTAFGQRRKQLRNSLKDEPWSLAGERGVRVQDRTGIDLRRRPETLSLEEWLRLDDALKDEAR